MFVTIFVGIYENPRRKNFTNPSYPKHPKIILIEIKNEIYLYFQTSLQCLLQHQKEV